MYPHRIRLRGPWECEPLSRSDGSSEALPPPCTMTMPCRWRNGGLTDFAGRVRFRRRFGLPRQIDNHERLWLTFGGITGVADIALNGQALGPCQESDCPLEREVTVLLRPRNELVVEVEGSGDGGLWGDVALEVRCTAFLRGVRLWISQADGATVLHGAGQAVGVAERPLDLYALLGGRTVAYTTVEPRPDGLPFQFTGEAIDRSALTEPAEARVELVDGGTVWYRVSESVTLAPAVAAKPREPRCP